MLKTLLIALSAFIYIFSKSPVSRAGTLPATLQDGSSHFLSRSLGDVCFSIDSLHRGLPCNPASIAKERTAHWDLDMVVGSNTAFLQEADSVLQGAASPWEQSEFLSYRETVEGEFSVAASFQTSTWGVAVEPYRLVAVSRIEEPEGSWVDFVIAQQQSAQVQWGSYVGNNFYTGIQFRYTRLRSLGEEFNFDSANLVSTPEVWEVKNQEIFFIEPGFLYAWEETPWQPQISLSLSDWGVRSSKNEHVQIHPKVLLGSSLKPLLPWGTLEVGAQLSLRGEGSDLVEALRGGASFQYGILQMVASLSQTNHAWGFLVTYKSFSTGLSYWHEQDSEGVFAQVGASL